MRINQDRQLSHRAKRPVVVITGASAGIGRATAVAFAKRGAAVALLARDKQRLAAVKEEVEACGGRARIIATDVSVPHQVESAAEETERSLGPIDVWVNNAMTTIFAPFTEISAEDYKRATEVTYLGYVYGTMAALKRMKIRDRGTIVQVGSALAYRAIPLQSPYCGAKFAIRGFTDSLRTELIGMGKIPRFFRTDGEQGAKEPIPGIESSPVPVVDCRNLSQPKRLNFAS